MTELPQISKSTCANCDSEITGNFCSNCGQSRKSRRGPIWQVSTEFIDEFLALDSKMPQSLFTLLFKPGQLSAKYLNGKIASVLPPVRLYLVISLLFFYVFEIPSPNVSKSNVYIGSTLLGHEKPIKGQPNFTIFGGGPNSKQSAADKWFEELFKDKVDILKSANPQTSIDKMFNQLEDIVPNALILFLPIFALVLKILYFFKRVLYFDHLIFALHFQTWLMILIMIIYGLAQYHAAWSALSVAIPIYLARAQKVVYQQTYWLVIPKTFTIIIIYFILLSMAAVASLLSAIALF